MKLIVFLAAATLAASPNLAQQPASNFSQLEGLVGHCWIGTFPDGKQTDEHCFEWVYDRKFIRDKHVVRGGVEPYQGETLYSWDPKEKRVVYSYYNIMGQVVTGSVEPTADALVFPSRYETNKGTVEIKAVWSGMSTTGYTVSQSQKSGSEWKPLWTMDMKRK